MKIAMSGTFDIGNFGDILFPIVAKHMLSQNGDVDLKLFSYNRMDAATWCYDVCSLSDFRDVLPELDLIIIGGGHLVHFNKEMAEGYYPPTNEIPHPLGFWWLPAVAGAWAGVPVATHGISSDPSFPAWGRPLLETFVGSVDYLTVRDLKTAERLATFGGRKATIVPDSIFSISELIDRAQPSAQFRTFRESYGLKDRYLIVQPSDRLWRRRSQVLEYAKQARERGWSVLELPIGFGVGNKPGFYGGAHDIIEIQDWPHPLLLAEIIANAEAAIGISLHLSVVASAYGIPVIRPAYSRDSKFILLDGLPNITFLEDSPPLRGLGDSIPDLSLVNSYRNELRKHWAALLSTASAREKRHASSAQAAWTQLCLTPAALLSQQSARDRTQELANLVRRRRNYFMHHVRKSIYRRIR